MGCDMLCGKRGIRKIKQAGPSQPGLFVSLEPSFLLELPNQIYGEPIIEKAVLIVGEWDFISESERCIVVDA